MKRIAIMAIGLLSSVGVMGQAKVENIEVKPNGGMAEVSFDVTVDKRATGRNYKLVMTPVMYDATRSVELSPIVVESRRTRIMDARNKVPPLSGVLLTGNGETIRYRAATAYQSWLQGADIRFDLVRMGCCAEKQLESMAVTEIAVPQTLLPVAGSPTTSTLRIGGAIIVMEKSAALPPEHLLPSSSSKTQFERINVAFDQGSSKINFYKFDNYKSLTNVVNILKASKDMLHDKIEIRGTASPEGRQMDNYALAENRALAARNYILDNVHWLRPSDFTIINGGEGWEELYKLVEASNMPGRWQVLDIIERTPPDIDYVHNTSRKKFLMDLDGGRAWKYMYTHFFPQLRHAASITIYSAPVAGEGGKFLSALPAGNAELINRAIDLTGRRNSTQALEILTRIENDPRAWNPMGVCYLLENNTVKAREYFKKAADVGYGEAKSNLDQIK